jgi:hypothetical protein
MVANAKFPDASSSKPSLIGSAAIAATEEQASATETAMRNQDDLSASMRYLLGFIR